jgi:oligoribonuclease (3'-5' exoribonuclease)
MLIAGSATNAVIDGTCDAFILDMHEKSGLRARLAEARETKTLYALTEAEAHLLSLAQDWPDKTEKDARVPLAGSSVHFDRAFLKKHLPTFEARLSYRNLDASGMRMFCESLGMPPLPKHESAHRAMADVEASIALARRCAAWVRSSSIETDHEWAKRMTQEYEAARTVNNAATPGGFYFKGEVLPYKSVGALERPTVGDPLLTLERSDRVTLTMSLSEFERRLRAGTIRSAPW